MPMEKDAEFAFGVPGTSQTYSDVMNPPVVQSMQFTLFGESMTVTLPFRAEIQRGRYRDRVVICPEKDQTTWNTKNRTSCPVKMVAHRTRFLDLTTIDVQFVFTGSGVIDDLRSIAQHFERAGATGRRVVVPGLMLEVHRLARLARLFDMRVGWGIAHTSLCVLGVSSPTKFHYLYTRTNNEEPDDLDIGLELYRSYDTYAGHRITWTLLIYLVSILAPVESRPPSLTDEKWFRFAVADILLNLCGPSASPEKVDGARFSVDWQAENQNVMKIIRDHGGTTPDATCTWDIAGSYSSFMAVYSPKFQGHEQASTKFADSTGYYEKMPSGSQLWSEEAEVRVYNEYCSARESCGLPPLKSKYRGETGQHDVYSPLLETEGTPQLAVRLHWELSRVWRERKKFTSIDTEGDDKSDWLFTLAHYIREVNDMSVALPYCARICSPLPSPIVKNKKDVANAGFG